MSHIFLCLVLPVCWGLPVNAWFYIYMPVFTSLACVYESCPFCMCTRFGMWVGLRRMLACVQADGKMK